jgi:general secretion pathway protein D
MKHFLFLILLTMLVTLPLSAVTSGQVQEETITLTEDMPLNNALQALETLSVKYTGQKILNLSNSNDPIGFPVHQLTWKDALELIALKHGWVLEEQNGVVIVKTSDIKEKKVGDVTMDTEQIRISATAFIADRSFLNSLGINWSTLLNGKVTANINFNGANAVPSAIMSGTVSKGWNVGPQRIDVSSVIKAIEQSQKGSVIARPSLIVASGKKGYIQVGQDFSVKQKDEAGNVTDKFFSTGVILDVTPEIITDEGKEAIHLTTRVERSSAVPGDITTIINKSQSTTELVMFDGEETVIGGLYDTEDTKERGGIPILKDLPWWVFGIRYLAGYDKVTKTEKELVIIIKAEIVGSVKERMVNGNVSNPEKDKVNKFLENHVPIPDVK